MKAYVLIKECLADRSEMDGTVAEVLAASVDRDLLLAVGHRHNKDTGMDLVFNKEETLWWDSEEGFTTMHIDEIKVV